MSLVTSNINSFNPPNSIFSTINGDFKYTPIPEFYANKNVLITGVTGFVGKVVLEKLLRSCPNIGVIYLIMRPKRGQSVQERFSELFNSKLFEDFNKESYLTHVRGIRGDLLEDGLGLSEEDRDLLQQNVNIVIHSAATVRFDEPLRLAIEMNLAATAKMLDLAMGMHRLQSYVHVSTAYANCTLNEIEEIVYEPPIDPQKLLDALSWMDDDMFERITTPLLANFPNTYTFTKQLAESLVNDYAKRHCIPLCIVRPSIITSSFAEPHPGWVDNFNGPSGLIAAIGQGLLHCMMGDRSAICDIIPVDMVSNLVLCAAWKLGVVFEKNCLSHAALPANSEESTPGSIDAEGSEDFHSNKSISSLARRPIPVSVYNCTSSDVNRFTWGYFESIISEYFERFPIDGCVRVPHAKFTQYSVWHQLQLFFNHHVPALLLDCWLYISGRKAMFVRVNKRIQRGVDSMTYFTSHEWIFRCDSVRELWQGMSPDDRKNFDFDVSKIKWKNYIHTYVQGIRKYALNEDPTKVEIARAHIRKLQRISFIINCTIAVAIWRILVKRVPVCHQIWSVMLSLAVRIYRCMPVFARAS